MVTDPDAAISTCSPTMCQGNNDLNTVRARLAAAYASTEAGIDSFPASSCCIGARLDDAGHLMVYAPHGLHDLFDFVVRPNPGIAPRKVYEAKTARWQAQWPRLRVLPWPP